MIDKPAGITVNTIGDRPGLAEILQPGLQQDHFGIVHRLDKDTTGVLILAKNPTTQAKLQELFRQRKVTKIYLALVRPKPKLKQARLELPLTRNPKNREKWQVGLQGRPAISQYQTLQGYLEYALLEIQIFTGRTHQIRAHLAHIHAPVAGDTLYGSKTRPPGLSRQFLHASELRFQLDNQEYCFHSPLPSDLQGFLDAL